MCTRNRNEYQYEGPDSIQHMDRTKLNINYVCGILFEVLSDAYARIFKAKFCRSAN